MRLIKIYLYTCLTLFFITPLYAAEHETIFVESTKIAEDITNLIITCKKTKDAAAITEIIKKLLCDTAQLTQSIIEKRKEKKAKRSIETDTCISQDVSSNVLNDIITTMLFNMYPIIEEISSGQLPSLSE